MSIIGIIIISGFVALGFVFLNMGPVDKEYSRRQAHWASYLGK